MLRAVVNLVHRLRTPRGCGLLLALLLADWAILGLVCRHDTVVSSSFCRWILRERPGRRSEYVASLYLVRGENGEYSFIDEHHSAGELARLSQEAPERVASITYFRGTWRLGFWAPWVERDLNLLNVLELTSNDAPSPAEVAASRRVFGDWLRHTGRVEYAELVARGDFNTRSLVWWGPVHDVLGAAVLLVLASCTWLIPTWVRDRSVQAQLRKGICPACGYDLSATAAVANEKRCPECGNGWKT